MDSAWSICRPDPAGGSNLLPGVGMAGPHPAMWREVGGSPALILPHGEREPGFDPTLDGLEVWEFSSGGLGRVTLLMATVQPVAKFPNPWRALWAECQGFMSHVWPTDWRLSTHGLQYIIPATAHANSQACQAHLLPFGCSKPGNMAVKLLWGWFWILLSKLESKYNEWQWKDISDVASPLHF